MNWFKHQAEIAERQIAAMVSDQQHEAYEHSLEETVRHLMHKLEERDREIARLRAEVEEIRFNKDKQIQQAKEVDVDE